MIRVTCPQCQKTLQIPDQFAGTSGTCTECGGRILVPEGGRSREEILRDQQGEAWSLAGDFNGPPIRPDGIRIGAGMLATEAGQGGRARASMGRMAALGCLLLILAACALPAIVIGFSAETKPPEPAQKPVVPTARGTLPTPPQEAAPAPPAETPPAPDSSAGDGGEAASSAPGIPPQSLVEPASVDTPGSEGRQADQRGAADRMVYITRTGSRYHKDSCDHVRGGAVGISLAEAQARGMQPCGTCGG